MTKIEVFNNKSYVSLDDYLKLNEITYKLLNKNLDLELILKELKISR